MRIDITKPNFLDTMEDMAILPAPVVLQDMERTPEEEFFRLAKRVALEYQNATAFALHRAHEGGILLEELERRMGQPKPTHAAVEEKFKEGTGITLSPRSFADWWKVQSHWDFVVREHGIEKVMKMSLIEFLDATKPPRAKRGKATPKSPAYLNAVEVLKACGLDSPNPWPANNPAHAEFEAARQALQQAAQAEASRQQSERPISSEGFLVRVGEDLEAALQIVPARWSVPEKNHALDLIKRVERLLQQLKRKITR